MKPISEQFIEEAETYLNTPWIHQGRLKGVGIDCIGLVQVAYEKVTGIQYSGEINYHRVPQKGRENRLHSILIQYLDEVPKAEMLRGDVLLFSFNGLSNHIGIYLGDLVLLHAWQEVQKVIKMRMDPAWLRCIRGVYRIGVK